MQRENAFDSDAVGNLSHREGRVHSSTVPADDDTLEHLNAFLVSFDDANVDVDGIAGRKMPEDRFSIAWLRRVSAYPLPSPIQKKKYRGITVVHC